ncbi:MAG: DUF2877 domain-containing protein [Candidatus Methylomirabilales bacterium]
MTPIITLNILAASSSLSPILQNPRWEGEVVARFRTSLLLAGPQGRLMHLQEGSVLVSPFALQVAGPFARDLHGIPRIEGAPLYKEGNHLEIPGCLRLSWNTASYYQSPPMSRGHVDLEALDRALQTFAIEGHRGGFRAIPIAQTAAAAIRDALRDREGNKLLTASQRILGLGPGLTPSGDDFLVGCLKGLWLLAGSDPRLYDVIDALQSGLEPFLFDRTTRVGAEFLRHALHGQFAEILDRAAGALLGLAPPEASLSAVSQLIAQGETSGTDTALGLLTGLEATLSTQPEGAVTRVTECHPPQ